MTVQTSVSVVCMSHYPRGYPTDLWEELDITLRRLPKSEHLLASNRRICCRRHRRRSHERLDFPYDRDYEPVHNILLATRERAGVPGEKYMLPLLNRHPWKPQVYSMPMASEFSERVSWTTKGRICTPRSSASFLASLMVRCGMPLLLSAADAVPQIPLACRMAELRAPQCRQSGQWHQHQVKASRGRMPAWS